MRKIIDCITFFNENFIFDFRFQVIKDYVDYFVICESKYDHKGKPKKLNFNINKYSNLTKVKYIVHEDPFPANNNPWKNQAIQREYLLKSLTFALDDDLIFFLIKSGDENSSPLYSVCANVFNFKDISSGFIILLKCQPASLKTSIFLSLSIL